MSRVPFSYSRWTAFIERHHRRILAGSALLAVLCALSLTRLHLDIDVLGMLPQGSPAFDDFKSFVADFGELHQLMILVEGKDPIVLQRFADELTKRLAGLDTMARVQSRVDVDKLLDGLLGRHLYAYIPQESYAEVARRLTPEAIDAQVAVNRAILSAPFDLSAARAIADDPLGFRRLAAAALGDAYAGTAPQLSSGYFTAADGMALLLFARPVASGFDFAFSEKLMGQVRGAAAEARAAIGAGEDEVRVSYTGSYVYALEDAATLKWDIGRYTVLALLGVLAVFYAGYRNLRILPFVTYPLLLTTLIAFALSLLLFRQLNAVSLCFAAILYGLSVDSMVYYYNRLLEELRTKRNLRDAVTATLQALARPDFTSSVTTAVAFLAIGTSVLTAVSQFGILTAVGMMASTVLFFVLYAAMSFWLAESLAESSAPPDTPRLERCANLSARHARAVVATSAVLAVILLFVARGVHLDVTLTHLRPAQSEAVRVQDEISALFGASQTSGAAVVRRADVEQALVDSEEIGRRLHAYRDEGLLQSVQSIAGALPSTAAQQQRLRLFEQLPRKEAAEALRRSLTAHGFTADKFAPFLGGFTGAQPDTAVVRYGDADLEPLRALIDHHVQPHGGGYIVATYFDPAAGVSMSTIAARLHHDLSNLDFAVASRLLLEEELGAMLRRELTTFCVVGVLANLVLLLIAFRHAGTAIAVLLPVALAVIALFAGMAANGTPLDPVNLVVTPLIFGVGVDYGVYVAIRARERGSAAAALRVSGRPLVVSALTTVAGFAFLALSHYPFLASMGTLAGIGLFLCLALSVLLLPALLEVMGEHGK